MSDGDDTRLDLRDQYIVEQTKFIEEAAQQLRDHMANTRRWAFTAVLLSFVGCLLSQVALIAFLTWLTFQT
ncbi:MAG: hypothetical protein CMJ64_09895 [Planctomycetaceae bacterium]|nr:hypothetical protein [Planctomycetaceae bacterium]